MKRKNWCTMFPDGNYANCCKEHDFDYSQDGTKTRLKADKDLRACIESMGHPILARVAYVGVRAFGWMFWEEKNGSD